MTTIFSIYIWENGNIKLRMKAIHSSLWYLEGNLMQRQKDGGENFLRAQVRTPGFFNLGLFLGVTSLALQENRAQPQAISPSCSIGSKGTPPSHLVLRRC